MTGEDKDVIVGNCRRRAVVKEDQDISRAEAIRRLVKEGLKAVR